MEIWEAKQLESQNFKEVSKLYPQLFRTEVFKDTPDFLEKYGIFVPEKKKFPLGYLKLWPQDFIVEEVAIDGELQTIYPDKFMHKEQNFSQEDPILYATLVKCGLSTIEAAEELAKKLGIWVKKTAQDNKTPTPEGVGAPTSQERRRKYRPPQNIKFGGIKDKHAITSQLISINGTTAEKLEKISSKYYFVKNISSGKKELFVGGLISNQFTILVRTGPDFKEKEFLERLKEVEKNGFYNFYYLQRFGLPRLISHYCGFHILKGEYEKAVFTEICRAGDREALYFQKIRKEMEGLWGEWEQMEGLLESFPLTFQTEIRMLEYLTKNPSDFLGALNEVPHQVSLWTDAFASLLFNKLLSFYTQNGKKLPKTLPLALGKDPRDWSFYEDLLKQADIFSTSFALKNLKNFPFMNRQGKQQKTMENVRILNKKIIPEGVIISFVLPKGCYATTFLSHLLNLVSGNMPPKFSNLPIDTKANLGEPSLEDILNKFTDVVSSPSWRLLWRIA